MISRVISSYDDFCLVMSLNESVRKRRSLERFKQQQPEKYEEYNIRYQMEQKEPEEKPKKSRRKKAI